MDPVELQELLDRELKQLPTPGAPATLLPRVLAAAALARAPWYRRPWLTWPALWQTASAMLLILAVAGVWLLVPAAKEAVGGGVSRVPGFVPQTLTNLLKRANEAAALMNLVWQLLLQPVAVYLCALAITFLIACAALWSALNRAALGEASWK